MKKWFFTLPKIWASLVRDYSGNPETERIVPLKPLLSGILNRYQAVGNQKTLELLSRVSPVAWQHIHFLGHSAFRDKQHPIDLDEHGGWRLPSLVIGRQRLNADDFFLH